MLENGGERWRKERFKCAQMNGHKYKRNEWRLENMEKKKQEIKCKLNMVLQFKNL